MNWPGRDQWLALLRSAGATGAASGWYDRLTIAAVDLSILGRDERRFMEFEEQVRREYAWVPAAVFGPKRAEILLGFLAREQIFATDWFRDKYEQQARRNLQASISKLRQPSA